MIFEWQPNSRICPSSNIICQMMKNMYRYAPQTKVPDFSLTLIANYTISWLATKFPDFSLTLRKTGISLTFPWPWQPWGFVIRHWTFAPMKFLAMAIYPPIAPSTFCWFQLPTGHGPATLACDAVEPSTTRQIGDSSAFDWIIIGVWSVGYRKHRTPISGLLAINRRFSWTQVF